MSISQSIKTKVKNDWLQAFPELAAYTQVRFYKIAGPIAFGIEIVKSNFGDTYRPYFNICPLWEENIIQCIGYYFFEIPNKKGFQFFISYDKHDIFLEEAVSCTRNYIQMPFEGNVSLKSIYKVIEQNAVSYNAFVILNPYLLKLHLMLYLGCNKEVEKLLKEIGKKKNKLLQMNFEYFLGNFDIWFENLKDSISRRDEFMRKIEDNKQDKKLKNMVVSEIII